MFTDVQVVTEPSGAVFVTFVLAAGLTQSVRLESDFEKQSFAEMCEHASNAFIDARDKVQEAIDA